MLTVVQQEVVGLRPFRQGLGWLRDLHYRGSSDVVHLHYSLSVQYPNCFPLPASRRDRHGAVGREPSNSTGGTFTRVARHCAGCCAGTMPLVWGERATRPFSAATCRRVGRTTVVHISVRASCARLSGGSPDRTGRWPVPPGPVASRWSLFYRRGRMQFAISHAIVPAYTFGSQPFRYSRLHNFSAALSPMIFRATGSK